MAGGGGRGIRLGRKGGGLRKTLFVGLIVATAGFLLAALPLLFGLVDLSQGVTGAALLPLLGLALGIAGIWALLTFVDGHFDQIERLQGAVLSAAARGRGLPEHWSGGDGAATDELHRLAGVLDEVILRLHRQDGQADQRLAAILGAIGEAIVVVTDSGLVSLFNARAARLLGERQLSLAGSIFATLERDDLVAAASAARGGGQPEKAMIRSVWGEALAVRVVPLDEPGGLLLVFDAAVGAHDPGIQHDLALHDAPPEGKVTSDTPLADLPAVVLDCEATGLDVAQDRIVSIGLVRLHGARLYYHITQDHLVRPDIPIPARSTAIHGITDAMVAAAPPVADILPDILRAMEGKVVIGHSIAFDMALMRHEAARHGLDWQEPVTLCTALLCGALEPQSKDMNLEAVARAAGLEPEGRHTALGDSLLTAELYAGLLPRLAQIGVTTLGQALELTGRASPLLALQRQAGWHETPKPETPNIGDKPS
ncbi:MAG: 3'-5' exonuclease [Alphaproteobacteria bacterium]|nr:3'-5' exonuclease [Alphaproteobacteria bacterium]MBU0795647.1 3'-5' exonuclease [Alphaproteobacteria bacterium]MBU0887270.1 3'-5' exonuclease [Alphaproteobacteria bacterium]MBU1811849.1 3'-5' exonuclease [Alphaproteobacteria bacterium]